jgi:hypothetical protein
VSQDKSPPLTSNHETSRCTSTKPAIQVQEIQTEKTKSHIKATKIDSPTLSQADIEEAIELCIAASEAMVITEVVSLDSDASYFPVCNGVEAALWVKEARKQMFENGSDASLEINDDETGSLSDLDECTMAAAYADVGFFCNWAPDSNSNIHSLDNYRDSILVPCSIKESTHTLQIFNLGNPSPMEENTAVVESETERPNNFGGIGKNLKEVENNPQVKQLFGTRDDLLSLR